MKRLHSEIHQLEKGPNLTLQSLEREDTQSIHLAEMREENERGRVKGFGRKVAGMLRAFRRSVERRPWLDLAYKITLSTIGGAVIIAGIAMLVLPGPGWLTIFLGLGILGTEFRWARRILQWLRMKVSMWADRWRAYRASRADARRSTR